MNLAQLIAEVKDCVLEPDYTDADITSLLNEAVLSVAAEVEMPDFKRMDVIPTVVGEYSISLTGLTGGFSGLLRRVQFYNGTDYVNISIFQSLDSLLDEYPEWNETGDVEAVALEGSTLWYYKSPEEATNIRVLYYSNPTSLAEDTDTPSSFPLHLHRSLFAFKVAAWIWDKVEDGLIEEKVNTNLYLHRHLKEGLIPLREWIARRRKHTISSTWSY